ncbi:dicarboxylate/amino acid:cation symporter [Herbaspirillum seropedicae]|uniref:dicarboxylate/amino acid:cation symporter n=1 Tax=Herbaspirillum seropedicae TaxID=964 RepID=UPI0011207D90|nr:dicarboxylate/amino acid:cation symporter [Herbaspirillum seropedicae]QDD66664.1 dicarboxylate/amino acid:cation symporter [Herbaspirillum seropedicae]
MKVNKLTACILLALILGAAVGYVCHLSAPDAQSAKELAANFSVAADIFLRLVKMIIAPLVFATLVAGITSVGDGKAVGRIGIKALSWFITASFISLLLGIVWAHVLHPGLSMHLPLPDAHASTNLKTASLNFKSFIVNVFPKSIGEAMATNEVLQIVVFSLFFGFALNTVQGKTRDAIVDVVNGLVHVMIKVTDYVMLAAPVGVFAAVAAAITVQGLEVLTTYASLVSSFYVGLASLWLVLIFVGYVFLKKRVFRLLGLIKEPTMIAFSTTSSEAAYPKTLEQLDKFGVKREVSGFVLPLGYAFNLDGSMMYQAFAMIFIVHAYGIDMSFGTQLTMLLVLMVSSKGMAGVSRASLVVVAATLPMFGLPESALLLIMGIDVFLDMGRTATNVIGNSLATAVVAKWEGKLGPEREAPEPEARGEPLKHEHGPERQTGTAL